MTASTSVTQFGTLYHVHSKRSGPTVTLMLHGVGGTWATWTPLLQCARDHSVELGDLLLVDLPGFGGSQNRQAHLAVEQVGAVLWDLVAELGWTQVRLAGHSMGGFLALDMASRDTGRATSVNVVSGAYFSIVETVQAPLRSLATHRSAALAYLALRVVAQTGALGIAAVKAAERLGLMPLLLKGVLAHPTELPPGLIGYLTGAMAPKSFLLAAQNGKHYDPAAQWARIAVPVRATFGSEDRLVPPADMARLSAAIPDAAVTIIDDVGHFGHIERPAAVLSFLFDAD